MPDEVRTEHRGAAWVILPTYNEAGNIGPMVDALGPKLTHDDDRILIYNPSTGTLVQEMKIDTGAAGE